MKEEILSIGIDIGTSTTQLIFSSFMIENLASNYAVPRYSIVNKKIIYKSEIIFTPLLNKSRIDLEALKQFIQREYVLSGILKNNVKTGAIIITGETARKENADMVLKSLSGYAGEFVVATAGPDLESVLSGYGACTNLLSKNQNTTIVNMDIGGGTSNLSYFEYGQLKGVACLDIGGRLLKINKGTGEVTYIYSKLQKLACQHGITIKVGDKPDIKVIRDLCKLMVKVLAYSIHIIPPEEGFDKMFTNNGSPLSDDKIPKGITFSGGVGDCIYREYDTEPFEYGDIGVLLAKEIKNCSLFRELKRYPSKETLRATVVGAGMHTTKISGSTILYNEEYLPLKNLPIVYIEEDEMENIKYLLEHKVSIYDSEGSMRIAIAFSGKGYTSFRQIQRLAESIVKAWERIQNNEYPLIIIIEEDIAKALGNAMKSISPKNIEVICVDGIHVSTGDYIDIGKPIADGQVLPVIVKTLIFNQ